MELRQRALDAFCITAPQHKAQATQALWDEMATLPIDTEATFGAPLSTGRPDAPVLVHPQDVPRRSPFTPLGHAALVHAIAHIEFNAINLALDAVWRFAGMPAAYYRDWLRVAQEEAKHFSLLHAHLQSVGYTYGDFVAHDGLWTVCENTRHSVAARMALVPRTMEARGLDATPMVQAKLRKVASPNALAAAAILQIILDEEVGHVATGNYWYHWVCARDGLDARAFYAETSRLYGAPRMKPPFNIAARRLAGFTEEEIADLPHAAP